MKPDKTTIKSILCVVFCSLLMAFGLLHFSDLLSFLGWLSGVLSPVFVGLALAFIVGLPMNFLERKAFARLGAFRRPLAMVLSYLFVFGVVATLLLAIVPALSETIMSFAAQLPAYARRFYPWLEQISGQIHLPLDELLGGESQWTSLISRLAAALQTIAGNALSAATGFTAGLVSWITTAFMGLIISIYVLLQKEALAGGCRMVLAALLPERGYRAVVRFCRLCYQSFSRFLSGQCLEAVIVGVVCLVGALLLQVPYAAPVSALLCVTNLVPMVGPITGAAVSTFLILLVDPLKALIYLVFLILWQQIEGNLIYPRVVGKNVGISPILVITAIILGSALGGILGILIAIPLCSVLSQLLGEAVATRLKKKQIPQGYEDEAQ